MIAMVVRMKDPKELANDIELEVLHIEKSQQYEEWFLDLNPKGVVSLCVKLNGGD